MAELKEWFNAERYHHLAELLKNVCPTFDDGVFLTSVLRGNDQRSLKQRLTHTAVTTRECLPGNYVEAADYLKAAAPEVGHEFVCMFIPEFFALYGRDNPIYSLKALREVTPYASGEFAVRVFLKDDLEGTLRVMRRWAEDEDHHVRRLASEGCRPRLPWSFQLKALMADPSPVRPVLEALKGDPEKYVQRSVANHLNDITKDNPDWMLDLVESWNLENPTTAWVVKHASRNLIKQGHPRSFALFGFTATPQVCLEQFALNTSVLKLGQTLEMKFLLRSLADSDQKLAIDYAMYYLKKNGQLSRKVFKLSECVLKAGESRSFRKSHRFQKFTTRVHYPGFHEVAVLLNGEEDERHVFSLKV